MSAEQRNESPAAQGQDEPNVRSSFEVLTDDELQTVEEAWSAATTPVEPTREEKLEAALWQIVNNAEAWHGDDAAKGRSLAIIALTGRMALMARSAGRVAA